MKKKIRILQNMKILDDKNHDHVENNHHCGFDYHDCYIRQKFFIWKRMDINIYSWFAMFFDKDHDKGQWWAFLWMIDIMLKAFICKKQVMPLFSLYMPSTVYIEIQITTRNNITTIKIKTTTILKITFQWKHR